MQYILTQAEYDDLCRTQFMLTTARESELQRLCTDAANHIPITRGWAPNDPSAPWAASSTKAARTTAAIATTVPRAESARTTKKNGASDHDKPHPRQRRG